MNTTSACSFANLRIRAYSCLLVAIVLAGNATAADNELSADEQADGWMLLFNGHDLDGWKNNNGKPVKAHVEDGTVNIHGTGGYVLVYDQPFGDFVLKCDVKMTPPPCNSGVFLRVGDLTDPVNTGLEVQVVDGKEDLLHDFGAIYDLVGPSKDATHGTGEWNTLEISCKGPLVSVRVNGEEVATLNCDDLAQPGLRADGTRHKFGNQAIKDFPRRGYVGLQDHGNNVWYKNIKLKKL